MVIRLLQRYARWKLRSAGLRKQRLETSRGRLDYYDTGPGDTREAIFLVHGLGTSASTWVHVGGLITSRYRMVALDLPGSGSSPLPPGKSAPSFTDMDEALAALADNVLPESFVLLGHSLGGWLAIRFAARHPKRVRHLILVNTAGIEYPGVERQRELFMGKGIRRTKLLLDTMWGWYPVYYWPLLPGIEAELERRGTAEFVSGVQESDFVNERLKELTMPVSIIRGRRDRLIEEPSLRILREQLPHARFLYLDRSGHVPQLEHPGRFRAALSEILFADKDGLARSA